MPNMFARLSQTEMQRILQDEGHGARVMLENLEDQIAVAHKNCDGGFADSKQRLYIKRKNTGTPHSYVFLMHCHNCGRGGALFENEFHRLTKWPPPKADDAEAKDTGEPPKGSDDGRALWESLALAEGVKTLQFELSVADRVWLAQRGVVDEEDYQRAGVFKVKYRNSPHFYLCFASPPFPSGDGRYREFILRDVSGRPPHAKTMLVRHPDLRAGERKFQWLAVPSVPRSEVLVVVEDWLSACSVAKAGHYAASMNGLKYEKTMLALSQLYPNRWTSSEAILWCDPDLPGRNYSVKTMQSFGFLGLKSIHAEEPKYLSPEEIQVLVGGAF